jgi:hypothetical protein
MQNIDRVVGLTASDLIGLASFRLRRQQANRRLLGATMNLSLGSRSQSPVNDRTSCRRRLEKKQRYSSAPTLHYAVQAPAIINLALFFIMTIATHRYHQEQVFCYNTYIMTSTECHHALHFYEKTCGSHTGMTCT